MAGDMSEVARKWDEHYRSPGFKPDWRPNSRVVKSVGGLKPGRALDLAMGIGANVLWLASKGWKMEGIEISGAALGMCRDLAQQAKYDVKLTQADLTTTELLPNAYDLILCAYYLDRGMAARVKGALKKGGHFFCETYTQGYVKYVPAFNPRYLLEPDELLKLYAGLEVLSHQETDDGKAVYATLFARKT